MRSRDIWAEVAPLTEWRLSSAAWSSPRGAPKRARCSKRSRQPRWTRCKLLDAAEASSRFPGLKPVSAALYSPHEIRVKYAEAIRGSPPGSPKPRVDFMRGSSPCRPAAEDRDLARNGRGRTSRDHLPGRRFRQPFSRTARTFRPDALQAPHDAARADGARVDAAVMSISVSSAPRRCGTLRGESPPQRA